MSKLKTVTSIKAVTINVSLNLKKKLGPKLLNTSTLIQVPVTSRPNLSGVNRSFLLWKLLSLTIINF